MSSILTVWYLWGATRAPIVRIVRQAVDKSKPNLRRTAVKMGQVRVL